MRHSLELSRDVTVSADHKTRNRSNGCKGVSSEWPAEVSIPPKDANWRAKRAVSKGKFANLLSRHLDLFMQIFKVSFISIKRH